MALKIHYNRLFGGDRSLWVIFFLLGMISLLVVYSSTTALVYARAEVDTWRELLSQLRFIVVGLLIVWAVHLVNIEHYNRYARLMFGLSLIAMLLVFVPGIGVKINGAYRWIKIPFTGITFQPSDFLKFSLMFILAQELAVRQKFIENTIGKVSRLKELILRKNTQTLIEVDGGVNLETGKRLLDAGVDVLVAGNFVFNSENPADTIKKLKLL